MGEGRARGRAEANWCWGIISVVVTVPYRKVKSHRTGSKCERGN